MYYCIKNNIKTLFTLILIIAPFFIFGSETISGIVFNDANNNGVLDANEKGIKGVSVSNQIEVVQTNEKGEYTLPVRKRMIIFVTKPSGYKIPLNELNLPKFYYIHFPKGSPDSLKYSGIDPTGEPPEKVNFPLIKTKEQLVFKALITGDPQPADSIEVGYFRDDIIKNMIGKKADLYMAMGDIANDNLNIYDQYNKIVAQLGIPIYNVPGNHDIDFDVDYDAFSLDTFSRSYGPPTYSFNYGKVHFIIMDDVDYLGWNHKKKSPGKYRGFINDQQLEWLENNLKFVPEDFLIVLSTHIQLFSSSTTSKAFNVVNRDKLFEILLKRKHLVSLSAHTHLIKHSNFDKKSGWKGDATFFNIDVGAGCGAWWSGPKNHEGIPESFALDGSPNGFFIFEFNGNKFNHKFISAKYKENYQMRIFSPSGVINKGAINTTKIIVNIFNADPSSIVNFQINGGEWKTLKNEKNIDPFISKYIEENKSLMPNWARAFKTTHIWTAQLPKDIKQGTHTIKVIAKDKMGNSYSGVQIFEIDAVGY